MLNTLTLSEVFAGLKERQFSERELIADCLQRIKELNVHLFSFTTIDEELAKGIPMAVKEVLSTKNLKTTASSQILGGYKPVYDATVVSRLKEAGFSVIGKTNCDAFAFGASTENSGFGITKNPWDLARVPGGSSGGSAVAVATDECIFALGTDTGGSIRQPASFCNIVGLKPTYGACSRWGLLAMASSFDCPGPMTKTVEDCEIVFKLMRGEDGMDATADGPKIKDKKDKSDKKEKITIGLPKEFFSEGVDDEVKDIVMGAAKLLEKEGFVLKEVSLPNLGHSIAVYYILVPSEISSNMARYDGVRFGKLRETLEDEVKRRIMIGTYTLSAGYFDQYYLKAAKVRSLLQSDFEKSLTTADVLLGPVCPTPAFKFGENSTDPLKMYLADILTSGVNLAGNPSLALPCGFTKSGLPVGMQIIGSHFSEDCLFEIGEKYQSLTDWRLKKPQITIKDKG